VKIDEKIRRMVKKPIGKLIPSKKITKTYLKRLCKNSKIITVGDRTTKTFLDFGIIPDIAIIDGKERRNKTEYSIKTFGKKFEVRNYRGTISKSAALVIKNAIKAKYKSIIFVRGEEDLLGIPALLFSDVGTKIFYGQPNKGIVCVKVSEKIKKKFSTLSKKLL